MDITTNVPEYTFIYMILLDFEVYLKLCTPANSWVRTSWVVEMRSRAPTNSWVDSSNCIVGCVWWTVAINFSCNALHWHIPSINPLTKPLNICSTIKTSLTWIYSLYWPYYEDWHSSLWSEIASLSSVTPGSAAHQYTGSCPCKKNPSYYMYVLSN